MVSKQWGKLFINLKTYFILSTTLYVYIVLVLVLSFKGFLYHINKGHNKILILFMVSSKFTQIISHRGFV